MRGKLFLAAGMATVAIAGAGAVTQASPPEGVTPTVLARGTYDAFKLKSLQKGVIDFRSRAKRPVDLVVRKHDYLPGSHTGWHTHPGPVFITVTQGELAYYEYRDRKCRRHIVRATDPRPTIVDDGGGHLVRNESGQPAQDVSVIVAPPKGVFRGELEAPGPHCDF